MIPVQALPNGLKEQYQEHLRNNSMKLFQPNLEIFACVMKTNFYQMQLVKPKVENKIINRLVTGVSQSESDYSDATQSDDSSKPRQKPKRKPNMAWCNMTQNNSTEDDDL